MNVDEIIKAHQVHFTSEGDGLLFPLGDPALTRWSNYICQNDMSDEVTPWKVVTDLMLVADEVLSE